MSWYCRETFLFMTLDPVHVGAGGNRLGRVDMTIAREPGTNLPKVPGTSLIGAARAYAAMTYGKHEAAGQQKKLGDLGPIKPLECPILYTFGTANDAEPGGTRAGVVAVSDARILFFPVYSTSGPIWVTTPELLKLAGFTPTGKGPSDAGKVATTLVGAKDRINVGWLLLELEDGPALITPPDAVKSSDLYKEMAARIVLVSPRYFSQIVNNHLEVRTSVSINPETGAAEEHALFTYEAIPRGAWLSADVGLDDYHKRFPGTKLQYNRESKQECAGDPLPGGEDWQTPLDVLRSGLSKIEWLGVGGMGTRGFGRMKTMAHWEAK
jgi:CRISPR-associated protein Cmr4